MPRLFLLSLGLTTGILGGAASRAQDDKPTKSKASKKKERAAAAADLPAVLWRDPGDIAARDLIYGMGGKSTRRQKTRSTNSLKRT